MSLLIKIDAQSKKPIFRQIIEQISEMVDLEAIKPGWRLPSTRSMAAKLEVNRSTVYIGLVCQMSRQYSRIERSDENLPMRATFRIDIRIQRAASR